MKRHDTPYEVAIVLARHAPRRIRALLDPAVGAGNLISPLVSQLKRQNSSVYCVDSDSETVTELADRFRESLPEETEFIHSDFLSWSSLPNVPSFDCIMMNPPFAATKPNLCRLDQGPWVGRASRTTRFMPLEAAFVCRALDLLDAGGRLLAIVPCSIVMSESLQWLRDEMLTRGAIRFVHELPPRTFPGVESRMYLLVFDKGRRQRQISLLNHDLQKPERLKIGSTVGAVSRLDFGYANAKLNIERLRKRDWLSLKSLESMAQVIRGDINSPVGPRCAVHTTDFRDGYWRTSDRHDLSVVRNEERRLKRGDILISRVGRDAHRSCGGGIRIIGMACSDCVLILRPSRYETSLKLLFSLKVMLSQEWVKPLLIRGTGASYISHRSLLDLPIPLGVCDRYPDQFAFFVEGMRARSVVTTNSPVQTVARRIEKLIACK